MPFKPNNRCDTCLLIQKDRKLLDRINRSKAFVAGGEPLTVIAADIGLSYESVYNHTKKHQAPSKAKLAKQVKQHETKEAFKEIQTTGDARRVAKLSPYTSQGSARSELIDKLLEMADAGEIKLSGNNLVSLLAQAQKEEEAAKDRGLEIMKMVNYFASGAAPQGPQVTTQVARPTAPIEGEIING